MVIHREGKQLPVHTFNNETRCIKFIKSDSELVQYQSVKKHEWKEEEEEEKEKQISMDEIVGIEFDEMKRMDPMTIGKIKWKTISVSIDDDEY